MNFALFTLFFAVLSSHVLASSGHPFTPDSFLAFRNLTITPNSSTSNETDVALRLDSANAIRIGAMRHDCADLAFFFLPDMQEVPFWVEGGCGTSHLDIWLRIEAFAGAEAVDVVEVLAAYGNASMDRSLSASFDGKFLALSATGSCSISSDRAWAAAGLETTRCGNRFVGGASVSIFGEIDGSTTHFASTPFSSHRLPPSPTLDFDPTIIHDEAPRECIEDSGSLHRVVAAEHVHGSGDWLAWEAAVDMSPVEDWFPFVQVSLCAAQGVGSEFSGRGVPSDVLFLVTQQSVAEELIASGRFELVVLTDDANEEDEPFMRISDVPLISKEDVLRVEGPTNNDDNDALNNYTRIPSHNHSSVFGGDDLLWSPRVSSAYSFGTQNMGGNLVVGTAALYSLHRIWTVGVPCGGCDAEVHMSLALGNPKSLAVGVLRSIVSVTESVAFESGMVFPATEPPPFGWEEVSTSTLSSHYLRVAGSVERVGTVFGSETHSHSVVEIQDEVPTTTHSVGTLSGCEVGSPGILAATQHRHTFVEGFRAEIVHETPKPPVCWFTFVRRKAGAGTVDVGPERMRSWSCFGLGVEDTRVCSGAGSCVHADTCECSEERLFGSECAEWIGADAVLSAADAGLVRVSFAYVTGRTILAPFLQSPTSLEVADCSTIVKNEEFASAVVFNCTWELKHIKTAFLHVVIDASLAKTVSELLVHPMTAIDRLFPLETHPDQVVSVAITSQLNVWMIVGIVIGVAVGLLLLTTLLVASVGVCVAVFVRRVLRQKHLLTDLNKLEDVDILLQEQAAREGIGGSLGNESLLAAVRVHKDLCSVDLTEIELEKELGRGGSGSIVFEARWRGIKVAFKMFNLREVRADEKFVEAFEREASLLASMRHPQVLKCYGVVLRIPRVGILVEFCVFGDIQQFIATHPTYPEAERVRFLREIALGMHYLHESSILHRDLKCANVLLDSDVSCKIMDFGLSRMLRENEGDVSKTKAIGTTRYMAPEMVLGLDYSEKVDVFSYGIMIWEIALGDFRPYGDAADLVEYRASSDPQFRPPADRIREPWLRRLAQRCWSATPDVRPSFQEVIKLLDAQEEHDEDEVVLVELTEEVDALIRRLSDLKGKCQGSSRPTAIQRSLKQSVLSVKRIERRVERLKSGSDDDDDDERSPLLRVSPVPPSGEPSVDPDRGSIIVYLKSEGQSDEEAEDFELSPLTLDRLNSLVKSALSLSSSDFVVLTDSGERLASDEQVRSLLSDCILSVRLL